MNSLCAIVTVFLVVALVSDVTEAGRCDLPLEVGKCRASHRQWGFSDGQCTLFTYGGCDGNANNFDSEEECHNKCVICTQPKEIGPCRAYHERWFYAEGVCSTFGYGGCKGNDNNFGSEEECQATCS